MKIDIGLYQAKYTLRALLDHIPGIARLSPNAVSLSSLVPAALAAYSLWAGWWLLVALSIAGRMVLVTLDGLIAEGYNKKTRAGPWVNRVPGVIGDVMLFVAWALIIEPPWGILLMGLVWPVNVFGILGLAAGGSMQSVGPAGRVDRMSLVVIAALLALVWPVNWTVVAQIQIVLLIITAGLRLSRSWRELRRPAATAP
jgi:CDP-diacylglycerol--glycerol-3-phosphate 3-phosphatidyltransferase